MRGSSMPEISATSVFAVSLALMAICLSVATSMSDNLRDIRQATRNAELSSYQFAEFKTTDRWITLLRAAGGISLIAALVSLAISAS